MMELFLNILMWFFVIVSCGWLALGGLGSYFVFRGENENGCAVIVALLLGAFFASISVGIWIILK